jgi:hypothetical protein
MFEKIPENFWEDPKRHKQIIKYLENQFGISKYEDWYALTWKDLERKGDR